MQRRGAKSFVDDLGLSRGVVLSRAAASLRSIETKPFDWEICPLWTDTSPARHSHNLAFNHLMSVFDSCSGQLLPSPEHSNVIHRSLTLARPQSPAAHAGSC